MKTEVAPPPKTEITPDLQERISAIPWFHRMELAPGIWTPGVKVHGTQKTLNQVHMPADLTGKSVLDVGAWDGFYSFEAERRGASRVLATDSFCWSGEGWGTKAGFELAREVLKSKVEDMDIDCMDITPDKVGTFDVVLFLGVLYHLKNPMEAVERMSAVTKELLILETLVDLRAGNKRPIIAFYPDKEANNDPTNWCGPNPCAVEAMLKVAGFDRVDTFYAEPPDQHTASSFWHKTLVKMGGGETPNFLRNFERRRKRFKARWRGFARAAFHAWKD